VNYDWVREVASAAVSSAQSDRKEFLTMVDKASQLDE
jgi:hypothetical protein